MERERYLREIRRSAEANGGRPPGARSFEKATGMTGWLHHWARWGDALREAGFEPNQPAAAYTGHYVAEHIVRLARQLGHYPTWREWSLQRRRDPSFPGAHTAQRMGGMDAVTSRVIEYCRGRDDCGDVLALIEVAERHADVSVSEAGTRGGVVYLYKSGRRYKIGKTTEIDRRTRAFRLALPDPAVAVHLIETDDIDGIEAYWHRRVESKRVGGEFFELKPADVQAFRRRRRFM